MRKILALTLAAVLALAPCALAQKFQWSELLTVEFPDGWLIQSDDVDNTDTYKRLVTSYDERDPNGLNVTVEIDHYEERAETDLNYADEADLEAYQARMLAEYAAYAPRAVGTVFTDEAETPFFIFEGTNAFGPFRQAETCVNGTVVKLFGYAYAEENVQNRAWTAKDDQQFEGIVKSLVLIEEDEGAVSISVG